MFSFLPSPSRFSPEPRPNPVHPLIPPILIHHPAHPFILRILILLLVAVCSPGVAQVKPKKAVFILVDGIPADVVEKVNTPHLDRIARQGRYLRAYVGGEKGAYSESPTISAVGYNSLLTGTWVHKHNVPDNSIKAPNYHYPTIFRLLEDQDPARKMAIFSSWTDNRTKLLGEGLPQTGNLQLDFFYDGYELDTVRFPHDKDRDFMLRIDETVATNAANCLKGHGPDLSWVYLEYPDDMGHRYGDGERFYRAVERMDAQVGRIAEAVQYRQREFGEDWLLVVTTDHGRDSATGRHHGGQSERERTTWLVTNHPGLNGYAGSAAPGIVDIMPTLARHLGVSIPPDVQREIDGVPLVGPVSLAAPRAAYADGTLTVGWKALDRAGTVKVWLTETNDFSRGGTDDYRLLAEVPVSDESATVAVDGLPAGPCKIVLEGRHNAVNRWLPGPAKREANKQ
jgi:hypothetical protein